MLRGSLSEESDHFPGVRLILLAGGEMIGCADGITSIPALRVVLSCISRSVGPKHRLSQRGNEVMDEQRPRILLMCHGDASLDRQVMPRWIASFATLAGIISIREPRAAKIRRARREWTRSGLIKFLDVVAFRLFYRLFLARKDLRREEQMIRELSKRYADIAPDVPVLDVESPNSNQCQKFVERCRPNLMIARAKFILREKIFTIPTYGTLVMHPGICPEYRNSHGCFWALAMHDIGKVGMSLLRIDPGIDTGPIFGYFSYPFDDRNESHIVIQARVVYDNLDRIATKLLEVAAGTAQAIDTSGRPSAEWGQPTLTAYLRWKGHARRRARCRQ